MAKTPPKKSKAKPAEASENLRRPVNELPAIDALFPVDSTIVEQQKIVEIGSLLWFSKTESEEQQNAKIIRAIDLYESLEPSDGAEGMLAAQMVGTHSAALECLRRAAIPGQALAARDQNLKHATKLMSLYAKQLETLNKHRGKGQQKVTVEHVNVAAGGQAIVGNVDSQSRAGGAADQPLALDAPSETPIDLTLGREPSKSKVER